MRSFDEIFDLSAKRHGGREVLKASFAVLKTREELSAIPDDRWLSMMTRRIFQAGFNWRVVDNKWEGFEAAFEGFTPARWGMMSDEDLDRLLKDTRIVRYGAKIEAVQKNAQLLTELAAEHGSAARAFADWPDADYVGLLALLNKRGARLGGTTGQYFLRSMGKDSFVLSRDVVAALVREGVVEKKPTAKKHMQAVQQAFTDWSAETGMPMAHISRILATSIDSSPTFDSSPT